MTQGKKLLITAAAIVAFVLLGIGLYSTTKNDTEKNNQAALQRLDEISKRLSDIGFRVEEINGQITELDAEKDNLISEQTKLNDEANVLFLGLVTPEMVKAESPDDSEICPIKLFEKYEWDCVNHLDEQKPEMFPKGYMDVIPTESRGMPCLGCSHYDADTNSCIDNDDRSHWCEANFPTDTLEEWIEQQTEWHPGQLTEDGSHQVMPVISGDDSHQRFKNLMIAYGLDPSQIWTVENHYGIKEGVIGCITVAETSGGNRGAGAANIGSVGSNDRGDRPTYALMETGLEDIGKTLVNKYLGSKKTLGCLSNAGSCIEQDDNGKRYATSTSSWEANMVTCLDTIYGQGTTDPATFNIRR